MDIYFALQSDSDGTPMTGQASNVTVYLSIDGGSFTASTNSAAEIGLGAYKVALTSAEAAFSTLLYAPVCTGAQSNIYQLDAAPTIPTASDNAQAVWGAQTKEITGTVTINATQAATLATASALATVGDNVAAVKAKTDNLPATPAAVGSAMTLTSETVTGIKNGLSTFDPSVSTVTINSTQAAAFATSTAQTSILALLKTLYSGLYHWEVNGTTLTIYDADGLAISAYTLTKDAIGNIIAVTPED